MLTLDLVRVRRSKGSILPRYVKMTPKLLEKAEVLLRLYEEHIGRTRGELEEAIRDVIGDGTDYLMQRGLSKLLSDRSEFEMTSELSPREVRQRLFELSAEVHPVALVPDLHHRTERSHVIAQVAEEFGVSSEQVEASFYADLQDSYILTKFEPMTPDKLLQRYNVALAQAVLFRATQLRVELYQANAKRLRQLMRYIKFFRLIADIKRQDKDYVFVIDGPVSLFRFCQKYGLQMANFLPALLLCEDWKLEAELRWDDKRDMCQFALKSDGSLVSYYKDRGVYVTEEEQYFRKRWKDFTLPWSLQPQAKIVRLGTQEVSVTDYLLRHEDGREVWVEIVGFWHRQSLLRKIQALKESDVRDLILVAPSRLRVSESNLQDTAQGIYFYKDVIHPKRVCELAETVPFLAGTSGT